MPHRAIGPLLMRLLGTSHSVAASVLSSSKLEACTNDGSEELECEKKIVLTISLEHGQKDAESAEFLVGDVSDGDAKKQQLAKPLRVTWTKSPAYWRYPLRYIQEVNNKPVEVVVQTTVTECDDNPLKNDEDLTCGVARRGTERVPDSEGFCCGCGLEGRFSGTPTRGQLDCGILSMSESAHCLGFDRLWYSVFEVERPQVFYDIQVALARPENPGAGWRNVTYSQTVLRLSHQQPITEAPDGALRVQLVGDLATATAPHRFESRYLAVPSTQGHPRASAARPLRDALLVDKTAFDLSGMSCDKVGVSYTAFKRQPDKCDVPAQSCLKLQLDDLHREDVAREERGSPPRNLVRGFCSGAVELGKQRSGSGGSTRFLACPMEQRHTTLLRLEVRADEAMFVTNVATGKIVRAEVPSFEALQGGGEVAISMVSTGRVTAQFFLGVVNCSKEFAAGPAVSLSLEPYETAERRIRLIASQTAGGNFACSASLSNAVGKVVDVKVLRFNVSDMKVVKGAQVPVERQDGEELAGGAADGGTCADVCPSLIDVLCFVAHDCWGRLGSLLLAVAVLLAALCGCAWCCKRGLWCRLLRCLLAGSSK